MKLFYCSLMFLLLSCGNRSDILPGPDVPEVIDPHAEYRTIGPPIGAAPEAVAYIEELAGCDILTWCEIEPDILVSFDTRSCGRAGAGDGRIGINDPERCEWVEDLFGLGLAVHEIIHVLGHWHHDEDIYSVMNGTIQIEWYVEEEDIEWLRTRCIGD